jgi:hypothetical protein
MTKFFNNVKWLEPFFNSAKGLVPLEKVKYVKGYKVVDKNARNFGGLLRKNYKSYNITLKIFDANDREEFIAVILDTLAHELAHVVHWEHTPDHLKLQAKILVRFATVAKQLDIEDTYHRAKFLRRKS